MEGCEDGSVAMIVEGVGGWGPCLVVRKGRGYGGGFMMVVG